MINLLTIALLIDDIGGALALVPPIEFGVDERAFNGEVLLVLLILDHILRLRALIGLVAFLIALEACHSCSLLKLLYHVLTVILRRLDNAFGAHVLQSCHVPHEPFHFLLELIFVPIHHHLHRFPYLWSQGTCLIVMLLCWCGW